MDILNKIDYILGEVTTTSDIATKEVLIGDKGLERRIKKQNKKKKKEVKALGV